MSNKQRHIKTLRYVKANIPKDKKILDLGYKAAGKLSEKLTGIGYNIINTDFDLDRCPERLKKYEVDLVMGFQVLEHLIEPAQVLKNLPVGEAFLSVPLIGLFREIYWEDNDPMKQHYHEFTVKQFNKLIDYSGFRVADYELMTSYSSLLGKLIHRQPRFYFTHIKRK